MLPKICDQLQNNIFYRLIFLFKDTFINQEKLFKIFNFLN